MGRFFQHANAFVPACVCAWVPRALRRPGGGLPGRLRPACEPAEEFVLQLLRVQASERVSAGHEQRRGTTPSVRTDALGCKRDRRSAGASTRMYLPSSPSALQISPRHCGVAGSHGWSSYRRACDWRLIERHCQKWRETSLWRKASPTRLRL